MARTNAGLDEQLRCIPKEECAYVVPNKSERRRVYKRFYKVRKKFVKFLAQNHADDLRQLGLSETAIVLMREEGVGPEGFTVHHKLPRQGGGTNDFSNLILIPKGIHQKIHDAIDSEIREKTGKPVSNLVTGDACRVFLPMPVGMIYHQPFLPGISKKPDILYPYPN